LPERPSKISRDGRRECHARRVTVLRDEAVVLRAIPLGEADRIVTLLTRRHGRLRAVAKGVRRTRSRFGARLEPGAVVDVQLWEGRSLDVVREAVGIASYGESVVDDYPSHTAAQAILEATERLTSEERQPAPRLYGLTTGALAALAQRSHAPTLVLDAFLLRGLAAGGYGPSLRDCAHCGEPGPHRAFAVALGGVVCPSCRPPGAASPSPAAVALAGDLLEASWPEADDSDERARRETSGLVAALVQWHLGISLRSLPLVERTERPPLLQPVADPR
jgi:DNA repair protein RecO (recombination protein O)